MDTTHTIPEHLQEEVNQLPEYGHGVTRISVTLNDGQTFGDVFVAWGVEIVKVGTSEEIPFDASTIVKVVKQ